MTPQPTTAEKKINQCPEFPFFGATYPDAVCIDGILWDLDSYEDGLLTQGGEIPCPFCNQDGFIEYHIDEENGVTAEAIIDSINKWRTKYGS